MVNYVTAADLEGGGEYYDRRWLYFSQAIKYARVVDPTTVLELGPHRLPFCAPSDTIDIVLNPTFKFDASHTPWPIDKHYDLFIALQVFEHLEDMQAAAFAEARRLADHLIISIPFRWDVPNNPSHHLIGWKHIREWFDNPTDHTIVGTPPYMRWVGYW